MITTFLALLCCSFTFLWLCTRWIQRRLDNPKCLPLPPGPRTLPLIGNYYDMPPSHDWLKVVEWSKIYGDLIHTEMFGTHFIYINNLNDARNMLNKRSALYSDRPKQMMAEDVAGWNWLLTFQKYGLLWRKHRQLFHQYFHASASNPYRPLQLLEARRFVARVLESPHNFAQHARLLSTAIIMRVVYGIDVKTYDDEFIKIAEGASESIVASLIPGRFLVDVIPALKYVPKWFPGAKFQQLGTVWRIEVDRFKNVSFEFTKNAINTGKAPFSVVASMLQRLPVDKCEEEEEIARNIAGVAYVGGNETTTSFILSLLIAMLLNPASQKKAHDELDAVLGRNRLPDFDDYASLPYVEAIVMETLRWHPVVPIITAHRVTQNDEYNGYFIPKGSVVLANAWAMLHDEIVYPNPEAFIPERFLDKNEKIDPSVLHPKDVCFGFGRRICPGRHMGYNSIFIAAATILAVLRIEHALDEKGIPIPVKDEVEPGFIWIPTPFKCLLKPRTSDAANKVQLALNEIERSVS